LGDAKIDDPTLLTGEYQENRIIALTLNMNYAF